MKKQYSKPTILVIEMEASELMMTSAAGRFTEGNGIIGEVSEDWSDLDGVACSKGSDPWQNGLWDESAWN